MSIGETKARTCVWIYTRGKDKGTMCGKPVTEGSQYCKLCIHKIGAPTLERKEKEIITLPEKPVMRCNMRTNTGEICGAPVDTYGPCELHKDNWPSYLPRATFKLGGGIGQAIPQ